MISAQQFRLMRSALCVGLSCLLAASVMAADAGSDKSFLGTWSMNSAKSKGDLPSSYTATFSDAGDGKVHAHAEWVEAGGAKSTRDYTAKADGKPAKVTGDPTVDAVRITSQKPGETHVKFSKAGKVLEWAHYSVSADGNSIKGTESARDDKGATVSNHLVFDRQ